MAVVILNEEHLVLNNNYNAKIELLGKITIKWIRNMVIILIINKKLVVYRV